MAPRAFFFACALGLVSGCGDEQNVRRHDADGCRSGVAIVLESFGTRFAAELPVTLRACFDQDCDVVRIVDDGKGPACAWDPGGPPAQLTTCTVRKDGAVEIDIARVDGQDYGNGARHVVAISVTANGATAPRGADLVLYSHVEEVRLVADGDSGCFVDGLDLRP